MDQRKDFLTCSARFFFFLQRRDAPISLIHWFVLKGFLHLMKEKEDV